MIPRAASASSQPPIVAYSLDAGEGAVAEDLTGDEHEGAIEGATWTSGKYGGALRFDGENDCVTVPESIELQFLETEEFTLEAWVRPSAEGIRAILTQDDESGSEGEAPFAYSMLVGGEEEGAKGWLRKGGEEGHEGVGGGEPLAVNVWSHLAFTDDGAKMRIYVDGQLVGTQPAIPLTAAKGPLTIGCLASFGNYFKGKIDEVRIYDRALDGGEVAADKNAGIQTPPSPVAAAYSFDENEGTVAHDFAGGHDGTIEGATWAKGKFGSALQFDGENDCVKVPESAELQFLETEEFTLEAWVRPSSEGGLQAILTQEDEESGEEEPFSYSLLADGEEASRGWLREGGTSGHQGVGGGEPIPAKAWSHLAFTDDGATIRFYIDGQLVGTQPAVPLTAAKGPLAIGCLQGYGNYFKGRIDNLRLYSRALAEGEITADVHTGVETPSAGPVAAYSLDAGEGAVVEDTTGDEHEGAIEGATWTSGKYGSALSFDGENDCVEVPDSADLQLAEEFTLEAWVRPSVEGSFAPVFFKEAEGGYSYSLYLGVFEKGALEGFVDDEAPGFAEVSSGEPLPSKTWTHVAFTSDGAHLRLYVNGQLLDTASARDVKESEGPLYLGCFPNSEEFFKGKIDEVRIYDRALDGGEVRPDVTPPTAPTGIEATYETTDIEEGEGNTFVTWSPAIDPPFSDGHPGSGVRAYEVQFKAPGDPSWSPVQTTDEAAFSLEAEENQQIKLKINALDTIGNHSPVTYASVAAVPAPWTAEDIGREFPYETGKARLDPEPSPGEEGEEFAEPSALDSFEEKPCESELVCGTYYGRAAAKYAIKWNLIGFNNEEAEAHRDPHYGYYGGGPGGDCTNFASAALKAGGMRFMRSSGRNSTDATEPGAPNDYLNGPGSWWSYFFNVNEGPFVRHRYEASKSWAHSGILRRHLLEYGLARVLEPTDHVKPGDFVFYNLHGLSMANADHTQIVTGVGKRGIAVSQHSPGYRHSLRKVINDNNTADHRLYVDWTYEILRPVHIVANIEE